MNDRLSDVFVRLTAIDPPFVTEHGVLFGLQTARTVDDPRPANATTTFETALVVVRAEHSAPDFRGEHVHGRKGDRFVYLSWGVPDAVHPFVMFARSKIKLNDLPVDLLDEAIERELELICAFETTDGRGRPATGSIRPPAVAWSIAP